jgi:hypothetical protein
MPALRLAMPAARSMCFEKFSFLQKENSLIDRLFFWKRWSVVFLTVALVLCAFDDFAYAAPKNEPASQNNNNSAITENERVIIDLDGKKIVLVQWAIGSRENIVTLRVPLEHTKLIGGPSPHYPDPNYQQPFRLSLLFDGMLWDLSPVPRGVKLTRPEQNLLVFGMVDSVFYGSKVRNAIEQLHGRAIVAIQGIHSSSFRDKYKHPIVEKQERFGLRRIGAAHDLGDQTSVFLHDLYYAGERPEEATDFMLCTDDAVPDDPPPGKFDNPGCQHSFALPELSATVQMSYRRRNLSEWRDIKRKVINLLLSWKPSEEPQ